MEGFGEYRWPDGRIYKGNFKADLKEGLGTLIYPDGQMYTGNWAANK